MDREAFILYISVLYHRLPQIPQKITTININKVDMYLLLELSSINNILSIVQP